MTKRISLVAFTAVLLLSAPNAIAQGMSISENGARKSAPGPAEYFTGHVIVTPVFPAMERINAIGGLVEFSPGARSAWHTHPAGQTLLITSGTGWVQEEHGQKIRVKAGDVIATKPGVKHWHGATASTSMSHMAVTGVLEGKNVTWLERVTDAQYDHE